MKCATARHMLDVCVDFVGRDGVRDMHEVVRRYVNAINAPLMLDSTNPAVMEAGLKLAGGRCVLNSMNLEDGEEKLAQICAAGEEIRRCRRRRDDRRGQAATRWPARPSGRSPSRQRIRDLAVEDTACAMRTSSSTRSCCPISTGIEEDRRNALETIEGTRRICQAAARSATRSSGCRNVSFGLKPAARVVLNSAFLHELREAGLTGAIVHASKILPKNRIPEEQWNAALDLIYDRRREGFDPLTHFHRAVPRRRDGAQRRLSRQAARTTTCRSRRSSSATSSTARSAISSSTSNEALKTYPPLDIINNILLDGHEGRRRAVRLRADAAAVRAAVAPRR